MYNNKYILGLDIGISSVGWGLLLLDEDYNPYRILDVGSRIFTPGEVEKTGDSRAKERREKRGTRRIIRRREFRVDRVRNILYEYGFLKRNFDSEVVSEVVSEKNEQLTVIYNNMITNYYRKNSTNPYKLKVAALDRKLSDEELCIILVHYAKKRGYKSNRESDVNSNDGGKVLKAINENREIMSNKQYRTISEMYIKDEKFNNKIKNSPNEYKMSVTREMYLAEINLVLDKQITYGLITKEFKDAYINIWQSQRHYAKGPGGDSPYGGDLIERMVGKCAFDNEPRAPKFAPSSEIFVALTKLLNLRYKSEDNKEYIGLNSNQINEALNKAKEKNTLTYKDLEGILKQNNIKFKDLQMSKKDYIKVIEELKKKLNIAKDIKVDIKTLNESDKEIYNDLYNKLLFSKILIELKGYHELRTKIVKSFGKEKWQDINIEILDELALFCTNYKLNEDIKEYIEKSEIIPNEFLDDIFIESLPNFKDHLMLSTSIIRKLIPKMLEGKRYDEAMSELGYNFSDVSVDKEKRDLLIPICKNNNITNQRVIRSLTQARKIINSIIKKYGSPKIINIETARELAKSRQERNEIQKLQVERQAKNEKIKNHLVELGLFSSTDRISSSDILKYKLWKEQNEFCAYSMKKITIEDLYSNNVVQIDHILPYSRTFNDNYLNKTLVLTSENQEKGNKTPFEWFGNTEKWHDFESFINNLNISSSKKDNYLLRNLDFDTEREMRSQNLNDTKYISKELSNLVKAYLNVEKVNVYQGNLTAKLRGRWGFNRLTHSYISETYFMPQEMKKEINKDRDNHLHHAMDALVIASITPSLQQKVTLYEKFSRYVDGVQKNKLASEYIEKINDKYINHITGEVIEKDLNEYLKEELALNHVYFSKHNVAKLQFPLPYEEFAEEAKIRVYEQNLDTLKWKLKSFSNYTNNDINALHTLTPSFAKPKISGEMHEDTYYGIKTIGDETFKTIRKSLDNIKAKDLESIPDKTGGSKDIYNAIKEWLGDCETGADALKKHNGEYPTNPNDIEHKPIKKIKIYSEYKNTGHMIHGSNVEKGGVYRIDVLKSKNQEDQKLYFVAYDIFDLKKIEALKKEISNDTAFEVKLDYGQGRNYIIMQYQELLEKYTSVISLNKNDLVKITLKDSRTSTAYIVGCSSGLLEVKSKIGDGYDIIGNKNLFNQKRSQYQLSISTIQSIRKLSINILGEIRGI